MSHRSEAPAAPPRAADLLRRALAAYRGNAIRIAGAAFVVLVPLNLLAAATATHVDSTTDSLGPALAGRVLLAVLGGLGLALGTILYAGVLDQLVAERAYSRPRRSLIVGLRGVPFGRLLLASILLAVVFILGLLLLLLPGLLAFTLFVLVGPLVGEGGSVLGSFRRSARLVRPHLRLVFVVVTLPMLGTTLLDDALAAVLDGQPALVGVLVVNGFLAATVGALVGLVEVVLTEELLARERAAVR